MSICIRHKRCWLCGQPLGKFMTFRSGRCACGLTATSPSTWRHSCAMAPAPAVPDAAQDAPATRRMPPQGHVAGVGLKRDPGVESCGPRCPTWRRGVAACCSRSEIPRRSNTSPKAAGDAREILASMESGLPILRDIAAQEGNDALEELSSDTTWRCNWCRHEPDA